MLKTRFEVVRQAIDVLFRRLERLPPSEETAELRTRVRDCMRRAGEWTASPPPDQERDELMKHVLALHVKLAKLEGQVQQIPVGELLAS
jgi:glycerol-3-phosphate dehydrogenase